MAERILVGQVTMPPGKWLQFVDKQGRVYVMAATGRPKKKVEAVSLDHESVF